MWKIYVFPYAHFWYLHALFLIFSLGALLDSARLIERMGGFAVAVAVAVAVAGAVAACLTVRTESNILSVNEACFLLPHFLLGVRVTRFRDLVTRCAFVGMAGMALSLGMALHQASLWGFLPYFGWNSGVELLCGMGAR